MQNIVPSIDATRIWSPPASETPNTSAFTTVSVFPGLITSARARNCVALCRPQEIDFELDTQDFRAGGHQTISGIPARRVSDRGDHARVQISILLSQFSSIWERDFNYAGLDAAKLSADQLHDRLSGKASLNLCRQKLD